MTHRCSLEVGGNDFLIDTASEEIYDTNTETTRPVDKIWRGYAEEIRFHRANGYSANCVICRDEAKRPVDVETMQRQLDELETAWTDALTKEQASAIFEQMTELQFAIEKISGRMDDYADARRYATKFHEQL